jgi:hypothetical protein
MIRKNAQSSWTIRVFLETRYRAPVSGFQKPAPPHLGRTEVAHQATDPRIEQTAAGLTLEVLSGQ